MEHSSTAVYADLCAGGSRKDEGLTTARGSLQASDAAAGSHRPLIASPVAAPQPLPSVMPVTGMALSAGALTSNMLCCLHAAAAAATAAAAAAAAGPGMLQTSSWLLGVTTAGLAADRRCSAKGLSCFSAAVQRICRHSC